jgi:dTDP-L-rhamnose 4-epimerase
MNKVLVIGGAGFIGSHTADALLRDGYDVRIADNLDPQVHPSGTLPAYLARKVEFVLCDVRDRERLRKAVDGIRALFYLAGAVGVGDSMYRVQHYAEANLLGAANLLDILANEKHSIEKIVLSSSVTVYGEGKYRCLEHDIVFPKERTSHQFRSTSWDPPCPVRSGGRQCHAALEALPTDEEKPLFPMSVYAITKRSQEELFLNVCASYGVAATILRYFNVFGTRQSLSNPYTGVAKIFATALKTGSAPIIYEDGRQTRDFVNVHDVVEANLLALKKPEADGEIFNVGTGRGTSILELAATLSKLLGYLGELNPSNRYRSGDVRHCYADISKIRTRLGFEPRRIFPAGLEDVIQWTSAGSDPDTTKRAEAQLDEHGLISLIRRERRHPPV